MAKKPLKQNRNMKLVSVYLTDEIFQRLLERAELVNRSKSNMAATIIEEKLNEAPRE